MQWTCLQIRHRSHVGGDAMTEIVMVAEAGSKTEVAKAFNAAPEAACNSILKFDESSDSNILVQNKHQFEGIKAEDSFEDVIGTTAEKGVG
eukprot:scaffold57783_cov25-Cyclotella_meneghiniana.AAC.1